MDPCVDPIKFARMKEMLPSALVHELLGCCWGRAIMTPEDSAACPEPAAQIVVLHPRSDAEEFPAKLCARHVELVLTLTTPHEEAP